jgi:capsid protein
MVAVLHRNGGPDGFEMPTNDEGQSVLPAEKDFEFADGMVFDDMLPGEDIKVLESNRPSPMLEPFRKAIGRRIAAGTKSGASEVLKDFSGSYSASRLELVNQYGIYGALTEEFVRQWKMQIYVWFVRVWLLTHPRDIPSDLDMTTVFDADYIAPATPWIDPYKEAAAWEKLQRQNAATPDMVVRMAGGSPRKVRKALEALAKLNKEKEIASSGDVANDGGQLRHEVDAVAMTSDDTTYNQS